LIERQVNAKQALEEYEMSWLDAQEQLEAAQQAFDINALDESK